MSLVPSVSVRRKHELSTLGWKQSNQKEEDFDQKSRLMRQCSGLLPKKEASRRMRGEANLFHSFPSFHLHLCAVWLFGAINIYRIIIFHFPRNTSHSYLWLRNWIVCPQSSRNFSERTKCLISADAGESTIVKYGGIFKLGYNLYTTLLQAFQEYMNEL